MVKKKKKKKRIHSLKEIVAQINLSLLNFSGLGQFTEAQDLPRTLSNEAVIASGIR